MRTTRVLWLLITIFTLSERILSQAGLPPQIRFTTGLYKCMINTAVPVDPTYAAQADAVSDGQGHHYVIQNAAGQMHHYLFDENGSIIHQTAFRLNENQTLTHPAITSQRGKLHVALRNQTLNRVEVWESTNGGSTWQFKIAQPIQGSFSAIDSYEDERGVHITHSTSDRTFYDLYAPPGNWSLFSRAVSSGSSSGVLPAIIATAESAHVLSSQGMFSFQFPNSGSGSWQVSTPPTTSPGLPGVVEVHIPPISTARPERYLFTIYAAANNDFSRAHRRYLSTDGWTVTTNLPGGNHRSTRAKGAVIQADPAYSYESTQFPVFVYDAQLGIGYYRLTPAGLADPYIQFKTVNAQEPPCPVISLDPGRSPQIGSNLGAIVFLWRDDDTGLLYFRRKPIGMQGSILENYIFRDTSWIVGNVTVGDALNQVELRLKAGSVTYILGEYDVGSSGNPTWRGPGALTINEGSTIAVEPGAILYVASQQSPGHLGGMVSLGNGVQMTIPSGAILQAGDGCTFHFACGTSGLTVQGSLSLPASGTVTFTRSDTTGTWAGITVSGSNTIRNAVISHAATGIKVSTGSGTLPVTISGGTSISNCGIGVNVSSGPTTLSSVSFSNCLTGVYTKAKYAVTVQGSLFSDCGIGINILSQSPQLPRTIERCSFANVGTSGVVVDNFSAVTLRGNSMTGPVEDMEAITLTAASPTILSSNIQSFKYAVYCGAGSSPDLAGTHSDPARNVVKNNAYGVTAVDYSSPLLGDSWLNTGMNSIFDNSQADVLLSSNCFVLGENNWWGKTEDPPGQFDVDATSFLYYDPWLQEDPNASHAPLAKGSSPGTESLPMIRQALHQRTEGRYAEFANTLRTIIQSEESSAADKEWSVSQLLLVAQYLPSQRVSEYLEAIAGSQPSLTSVIRSVLPSVLFSEDRASQALTRLDMNLRDYPPGPIHRQSLYQKFLHVLHASEDISGAWDLLSTIVATYPRSREERLARAQLATYLAACGDRSVESHKEPAAGTSQLPAGFSLSQNYPNPFNPTTSIRFDLPVDARVELAVFDVLGRRVATLLSDTKTAGTHSVAFDASGSASGVYFYRLSAEPIEGGGSTFHAIKKLMLVR